MYLGTLTIANGGTISDELDFHDYNGYTIHAPAVQAEVVNVELMSKSGIWSVHQADGTDIATTAGKVLTSMQGQGAKIRLTAAAAVAADRVYEIYGVREVRG